MHSVEMEEPEPHEVFLGLGLLICEGRLPGLTVRGYGEGPHCGTFVQSNPKIHHCEPDNYLCIREENLRKHAGVIWENGIPLCIEVLLCSDCQCGKDKSTSTQVTSLPDPAYVLLEQWSISVVGVNNKRGGGGLSTTATTLSLSNNNNAIASSSSSASAGVDITHAVEGKGLLHAVRSFLHFSQLSAWLSLTKGEEPKYIMYRVTMPQEDFAHKFVMTPQDHEFPIGVIKNQMLKVRVKTLPRLPHIPQVYCSSLVCPVREQGKRSPMLSEGLLDPPLDHRPKRYSSPPSRESPDHLLFTPPKLGTLVDDRLPFECNLPGKHHCRITQDNEEDSQISSFCNKSRKPVRSRQDLFIQSLNNRLISKPITKLSKLQLQQYDHQQQIQYDHHVPPTRESSPVTSEFTSDEDSESSGSRKIIPTQTEKIKFRKSLYSAASLVYHGKTKLPLTSSPAPLRKGSQDRFDFDMTLTTPSNLRLALGKLKFPRSSEVSQALLGSFEESVLNGRIEPVSTVHGFTAELGASGSFCPKHVHLPVTVFFYTFCDNDKVSTPYLAHINLGRKGYVVPRKGTVQVTLFNPLRTVIKMFVVMYDLSDMPPDSQTFIRQRILYMPLGHDLDAANSVVDAQKSLRYLIHMRFASSRSGKIYLHTDIRIVIFRKSDADTATDLVTPHELRSFTHTPKNPKYSPRIQTSSSNSSFTNNTNNLPFATSSYFVSTIN